MSWDEEAQQTAIREAEAAAERDPEAAAFLVLHAQAAGPPGAPALRATYDPMALYARVLKFYEGGISDADLDRMDYLRFYGYVREMEEMLEEQRRANEGQRLASDEGIVEADSLRFF